MDLGLDFTGTKRRRELSEGQPQLRGVAWHGSLGERTSVRKKICVGLLIGVASIVPQARGSG